MLDTEFERNSELRDLHDSFQFRQALIAHMQHQTKFLEQINDAVYSVKTIATFLKWAIAFCAGGFGLYEFFMKHMK